jgi:hypothetical protein
MALAETAVFGVYANPESLERAGDALVKSGGFSDSDICVLLPEGLEDHGKMGAFLLSVNCYTSGQAELAKQILEGTDAQASFSSNVAFLSSANIAAALSYRN